MRNLLAKAPCWNFPKRGGEGASHLPYGLLFLLFPIFHCHKIKDVGYNNITNTSKVSPTQNTPALQAKNIFTFLSLWDRRLFLHPKSANTRVHLRQYPVSNSVMKNLYIITFRQIPLFDYNFCHKQIAHHEPSLSSTSFISSTTKLFLYTVNCTPSPATWLTSVHSLTKLAENAQSPQHRNITFMKSNNTQYKIEYKNSHSSKQN